MSKVRSKRYQQATKKTHSSEEYELVEAVEHAKEASYANFDATLELHVNVNIDMEKSDQRINATTTLPYSTGKTKTICVVAGGQDAEKAKKAGADTIGGSEIIDKIQTGWLDFDVLIATPEMMQEVTKVARVLGPKGLMPNPKNNTVAGDITKAIEAQRAGQVTLRTLAAPSLHLPVGKVSQDSAEIVANVEEVLRTIKAARPPKIKGDFITSAYLAPTMGPSVKIALS